jgi:signal transduction histidine kinase
VRFDPTSEQFVPFSISEGLQEEEFNRLAYTKTKNGSIVLGGINGLNIFNPADISVERENFETRILSVTANDPISAKPEVQRVTDFTQPVQFNYNQNSISIHFFIAHYKQPKRFNLFYRFENVEKEWKEVTNENTVTYSNLQPGAYTFKLKTVGLNGQENIISLPIAIAKPFWQTWWFVLLAVCAISLMVVTIIRSYFKKNQFDRKRLESLLKLRTSEIEKSKEDLQILNQKKDLIFSILSHDLRSPLTTLKGFLGYIIDHAHELAVEDLKKHAISIRTSVTNSLDLIDNTLFWSLSQMGNIQYTPSNFSLRQLIDKLQGLYQLTADKKRIPLSILCDDDIMIHGDENMVYVTLRNLVSNALKFTTEGNPVTITCYKKFDYAEINVVDRGIGMSEEYLQKILSMDQPMLKKGTSNEKGTGLGLLLCKKFIELNKGELLISSIENQGTTFTVILPIAVTEPSTVEAN